MQKNKAVEKKIEFKKSEKIRFKKFIPSCKEKKNEEINLLNYVNSYEYEEENNDDQSFLI